MLTRYHNLIFEVDLSEIFLVILAAVLFDFWVQDHGKNFESIDYARPRSAEVGASISSIHIASIHSWQIIPALQPRWKLGLPFCSLHIEAARGHNQVVW